MASKKRQPTLPFSKADELRNLHAERLAPRLSKAPFVLKFRPDGEILLVSHRGDRIRTVFDPDTRESKSKRYRLRQIGAIAGEPLRVCLPLFREITASIRDEGGIPLRIDEFLRSGVLGLGFKLPLDEESGAKIGLVCRLQGRTKDIERVELMALRVARFSREEALYWLSRVTLHERDANRWAVSGLKVMLCGHGGQGVGRMLANLRAGR